MADTNVSVRTLDVQIIDLADEIAYAAHDLEDGLRQGLFSADEILQDFYNLYKNADAANELEKIIVESKERASFKSVYIDSSQYSKLYRKEIASKIINTLISDIGLVKLNVKYIKKTGTKNTEELGFVNLGDLAKGLKITTYNCINHNDRVYAYEENGEKILKFLFDFYDKHSNYLPPEYRAEIINNQYNLGHSKSENLEFQKRLIIDFISGMMDTYAETLYKRLRAIKE
jgi:dGTPase